MPQNPPTAPDEVLVHRSLQLFAALTTSATHVVYKPPPLGHANQITQVHPTTAGCATIAVTRIGGMQLL